MSRTLIVFLFTMILANISSRMFNPYLPLYLKSLGASVSQVGLAFTVTMLAPLAFQILGGWVSDTIGRLQAIVIGSLAASVGYVFFIFADGWGWVLAGMAFSSLAGSFVAPSFQAYVAEQADPKRLGKVYGLTEGLFSVVGIIGPLLGGFFSERFGFKWLFWVAGITYAIATIIRVVMARNDRSVRAGGERRKLSWSGLKVNMGEMIALVTAGGIVTWMLVADGVIDVSFSVSNQFQPIYLQDLAHFSNSQIGVLISISSAVTMAVMLLGGGLSDKLGERVCIVGGGLLVAAGMVLFLLTRDYLGFVISFGLFGMGGGLLGPAYDSLISKAIPIRLRGTAFGLFSSSIGVISLPAPWIGGILWDQIGPRAPFMVPVIGILLLSPVVWFKFVLPKQTPREELQAAAEGIDS
ncbi:arabinose efflux permease [Longilinea arvoryzae]|uniref:Arabinose efflux permease n=2 Tax=Longilinea arvoryzae TaxID=360412 RepID=A0A0K8MXR5_9CHLR|nr:arabinose efflux permease [Longilinea arvoryzae]